MASRILAAIAGVASLVAAVLLVFGGQSNPVGVVELAAPDAPTTAPSSPTPTTPTQRRAALPKPSPRPVPIPRPSPTPSPTASPQPAPTPAVRVETRSARIADLANTSVPQPVRLRLPTLDLDVAVEHVGVADDGQMEVPEEVDDAGWYRHGPVPGEPGNAVLAGHVDDRQQGLGAFHRLVDLAVGDHVEVEADDGSTTTWEVTGRELVDKSALETADLFRRTGPTQLVLVTCGGEFDGTVRSYRSNVVVVARPL